MKRIPGKRLATLLAFLAASLAIGQEREDPIFISGIYPHLTTYADNGNLRGNLNECGIGVVAPWAGKLWMVNYAAHEPYGSDHKLYTIGEDLELTIHPESVGGTPAGRMIHELNIHTLEVNKLFHKSVPGWHAKGAYVSQGRLVIANNGEHVGGSFRKGISEEEAEAISRLLPQMRIGVNLSCSRA